MENVFLTGVTGFIGGASACRLLANDGVAKLTLLVRAESIEHAYYRVTKSLARFLGKNAAERAMGRVHLVVGDLLDVDLLQREVTVDVTHVLHIAANTSMRSIVGVRKINIFGTLALAHRARRLPRLERFLHVSTAYACGVIGTGVVLERSADIHRDHVCEYTRSKAESEWLLENTAFELPLLIARPSVVVGHTRLGCAPSASIFWYYSALARLGLWPTMPQLRKDVVPVDYVADALCHLLLHPKPQARIYHVSAGEAAEPWADIAGSLGGSREPRVVSADDLVEDRNLRALLGTDDRTVGALGAFARFTQLAIQSFDNQRLLAEGMPPPPLPSTYLPLCAESVRDRSILEQASDDV